MSSTPPQPRPMRLLLTSSGITTPAMKTAFQELYHETVNETQRTNIIYIYDGLTDPNNDNNSDGTTNHQNKYVQDYMARQLQSQLGVEASHVIVPVELRTLSDEGAATLLQDVDAAVVYLEQGNTYYLLYQIRRTKLDESIALSCSCSTSTTAQGVERDNGDRDRSVGVFFVGASAGSIVAGRTIKICQWKNWDDPGHGTWWDVRTLPTGLDGLDLMDGNVGRSLFPHYSAEWDQRIKEMMPQHPEGVIILDEEQFYVQGGGGTEGERVGRIRRR